MRALSLKNPWAGGIYFGIKTVETRTWKTNYRGDILICCSDTRDENIKEPEFNLDLAPFHYRGMAICVVELWSIGIMHLKDQTAACCKIYPGAYAWRLKNVRKIESVPVKGELRLFDVPEGTVIKYI